MVVSFVDEVVECAHLFGADTGLVYTELNEYLAAVGDWVGVGWAFLERSVFGFHGFGGDGGDRHSLAADGKGIQIRYYQISSEVEAYAGYPNWSLYLLAKS